jgi:hypothetical protein
MRIKTITPRLVDHPAITAFAIDRPRPGDRIRGRAIDVHGWVLGRGTPVAGVRVARDGQSTYVSRLRIPRPDVAAAHPDIDHAEKSGFWMWIGGDLDQRENRFSLEAVLDNGEAVALAEIEAETETEVRVARPGMRLVEAPDFVILGAQRGGTTSLYAYLNDHPQVFPAAEKEIHFVTDHFGRGRDWYLGQFPEELPVDGITGEATPYALFHPLAPRRLRLIAPCAKLIVLLRNPVERAYSQYLLEHARGDETLDFAAALDAEPERLAGIEEKLARDPHYMSRAHKHASYLARGDYAPQLERWFNAFPREQFLVLRSEDLFEQPEATFAHVTGFLGIDDCDGISFAAHNRSDGPPIDPAVRRRLAAHFTSRNAQLAALLGWDPGWT